MNKNVVVVNTEIDTWAVRAVVHRASMKISGNIFCENFSFVPGLLPQVLMRFVKMYLVKDVGVGRSVLSGSEYLKH